MRVLLAGGGTAGHINPAIAIANTVRKKRPESVIAFCGTPAGMENDLVSREGYQMYHVDIQGFKRKLSLYNLTSARKAAGALRRSDEILDEFRPDVVIGTGGYVSWPVVNRAAKRGIPTMIHEQNAFPGLTSRMLSRVVDRVMISFDASRKYFKDEKKLILVGNPVRDEIIYKRGSVSKKELGLSDKPFVLSFAGSLGAREVNRAMIDFIGLIKDEGRIQLLHATGSNGWKWFPQKLREAGTEIDEYPDISVREYIYDMPSVMSAADIVISRAGAITLAELAVQGKPAILIPSPNVANDHQSHNARAFEEAGAAAVLPESEMTGESIREKLYSIIDDRERLRSMGEAAQKLAIYDSCEKIYSILCSLYEQSRGKKG